ncbi:MAG: hypothetical protein AAF478_09680 [Pseudomonadota bacterium]
MVASASIKVSTIALLACLVTTVSANTQSANEEPIENDFRADFLSFDEVDELTTGAVRKREEVFKYCLNVTDQALEARNAVLMRQLKEVEAQVDKKLDILAAQIEVLEMWTKKREAFLSNANESLVKIFQSMRPDAAAQQLTEMGAGTASSIIAKLEPKNSSAILAEMKPDDAAKISLILSNSMVTDAKK